MVWIQLLLLPKNEQVKIDAILLRKWLLSRQLGTKSNLYIMFYFLFTINFLKLDSIQIVICKTLLLVQSCTKTGTGSQTSSYRGMHSTMSQSVDILTFCQQVSILKKFEYKDCEIWFVRFSMDKSLTVLALGNQVFLLPHLSLCLKHATIVIYDLGDVHKLGC